MLSFVRSLAINTGCRYARQSLCPRSETIRWITPRDIKVRPTFSPVVSMHASSVREKALRIGIDAAVEDFVKTGTNICVGDGSEDILIPLLDAIAALVEVEGLVDVAFVATTESTSALMQERSLPSDLAVNFKKAVDLFIVPVTTMDEDCNIVLDSRNIAADRFAAELASQVVAVIHEDDFHKSRKGLQSIPVQLTSFLPGVAAESLCGKSMTEVGVRGCTLRHNRSDIADVSLAATVRPQFAAEELQRSPAVVAVGFLRASPKITAVLATNDLQPLDMTSPLRSLANISNEARKTQLSGEKREDMLRDLTAEWRIIEGQQEALTRAFSFPSARRAQAFVRYTHYVSSQAWHHPEIKESYNRVQICLTTYDAGGLSELDALFARELSRAYDGMSTSASPSGS